MKYYKSYMERQELSPERREQLLALGRENRPAARPVRRWRGMAALAACCALLVGVGLGVWRDSARPAPVEEPAFHTEVDGTGEGTFLPASSAGTHSGSSGGERMLPMIPYVKYQSVDHAMELAAAIALPDGAFFVELTAEDVQTLFWGPEGGPGGDFPVTPQHTQSQPGELPWMLFWEGYDLSGSAIYDGEGKLFSLDLYGEHPSGYSFLLELALDRLPPACLAQPGLETTDVFGTEVTGWSRAYDRNGDDVTDYICGSEFMAGEIGVRFENVGSPFGGEDPQTLMAGAAQLNALFVRQALVGDGGLYVDHLRTNDDIPQWRDVSFDTLAQAREEEEFAPYLPTHNMRGYGEFFGRLTYQEGRENTLFVRWSRNYDDVEVCVYRPDGDYHHSDPVDVSNPASYDTRLYEIPWSDSVPEEYRSEFYSTNFRAEDMSLAVVEARGTEKDTGGTAYRFGVLHPDGTLVQYSCSGLTAQQVWEMVEATL